MVNDNQARRLWILCTLFGLGVLAFVAWFGNAIPSRTCTGALPPGVSALLAFQLSRTPADVESVFGLPDNPCHEAMVAAMNRANTVDLVGFIATYGAFLACFFFALLRCGTSRVASLGLVAVGAALMFDALETSIQLHITGTLPGTALSLSLLTIGSTGKFVALALVCACAGTALIECGRTIERLAGGTCLAGGVLVVTGLVYPPARAALGAGNAIAWLVMLLYAASAARRPIGTTK